MAQRRMFSKTITNSGKFLKMPPTSRLLYYDLGMNADDDGYTEWFTIVRMSGSTEQDLQVLQANGFVKIFDDNVLVILDWKENNFIRSDRYTPSKYIGLDSGIPNANQRSTQVRLGKVRLNTETSSELIKIGSKEYSWEEYLEGMLISNRKEINVIGFYLKAKGKSFDTKEKVQAAIKRHLRPAKELLPFDKKEIGESIRKLNFEFPKFTLETVLKDLTK